MVAKQHMRSFLNATGENRYRLGRQLIEYSVLPVETMDDLKVVLQLKGFRWKGRVQCKNASEDVKERIRKLVAKKKLVLVDDGAEPSKKKGDESVVPALGPPPVAEKQQKKRGEAVLAPPVVPPSVAEKQQKKKKLKK